MGYWIAVNHKIKKKKEGNEKERKENIYFTLVGECIFLLFCPPTNKEVEIFTDDIPPLSLLVEARPHMIRSLRVCVESLYSCAESTIEQLNIMQVSAKKLTYLFCQWNIGILYSLVNRSVGPSLLTTLLH